MVQEEDLNETRGEAPREIHATGRIHVTDLIYETHETGPILEIEESTDQILGTHVTLTRATGQIRAVIHVIFRHETGQICGATRVTSHVTV